MRPPQVAPSGAPVDVAVIDVGDRHLRAARAEVHPQQRLRAGGAAPVDELVRAELVGLDRVPCPLEHGWPLRLRSDAVEPVVAGHEVAARVPGDGNTEVPDLA